MYRNGCNKFRKFKKTKIPWICKKNIKVSVVMNIKKYLKKKNHLKY